MYQPDNGPALVHEYEDIPFVMWIAPHFCLDNIKQPQASHLADLPRRCTDRTATLRLT